MVKTTTHYSVSVTVLGNDTPIEIENVENGIQWGDLAFADFKAGNTVKFPGTGDDAGCTFYIPYDKIVVFGACPTTTSSTVEDNTCVEE